MSSDRPDPDELLRRVEVEERRESRGKLTVFFGAAPGVGKTYAMLQAARIERSEGRDVVVGVVETHGRPETAVLMSDLELLPKKTIVYRGITQGEFDLDAALARRPGLLLVDELAHTNVPGSRHPKRWQDVEELLSAGLDVYTTMNVQHIESLNDVVAQITGVVVRETVPDSVLDEAHELRLVDLPADELLERLREGKVYIAEQARWAVDHFFRKGNLIALRELALRQTAERVDAQVREYRRDHRIEGTWPVAERVLVAVGRSPYSARIIRAASRIAMGLRAPWLAVYVETPADVRIRDEDRGRLTRNLRLAGQLGAEVVTLTGLKVAEEILRFARERNITKIVVGKPRFIRLHERLFGSMVDELVRRSGDIDVYVTTGTTEGIEPVRRFIRRPRSHAGNYVAAAGVVAAATALGWVVFGHAMLADIVMVYILGILLVSLRFTYGPSMLAALLSALGFNFFFLPPYMSFAISDLRHILTFVVMLVVAVVISSLTQRLRGQAASSRSREKLTSALYAMTREMARATDLKTMAEIASRHIGEVFASDVTVFAPDEEGFLAPVNAHKGDHDETEEEVGVIRWVWANEREAGVGTDSLPGMKGLYVLIVGPRGKTGVLGVVPRDRRQFDDPEQGRRLEAFVPQLAVGMDRIRLEDETQRARVEAEREQMRSSLLSSVSHDLRTPLAAMTGAASTLIEHEGTLDPETRRELQQAIYDEAGRLNRLVRNLLDMTRLESGSIEVRREWQPLEEVVGSALARLEDRLGGRRVSVTLPPDLPPIPIDAVLMEQALVNILENAIKHTPDGTPVEVTATTATGGIVVAIADRGPGVLPGDEERVFEKFYRAAHGRTTPGVGLGLAICKAIVTAHGGRIWVENRRDGGASFQIFLPLEGVPPRIGAGDAQGGSEL